MIKKYLFTALLGLAACQPLPTTSKPIKHPVLSNPPTVMADSSEINWVPLSKVKLPKDKVVLIFIYSDKCEWCLKMKESFKDPRIIELVKQDFYPIRIETEQYPDMAKAINNYKVVPLVRLFTTEDIFMLPGLTMIDSVDVKGYIPADELFKTLTETANAKLHATPPAPNQP